MSSHFYVTDENPNPNKSCLCHPQKCATCHGPFVVFPEQEMENVPDVFPVLSVACASEALSKFTQDTEQTEFDI